MSKFIARSAPPANAERWGTRPEEYSQWHRQFKGLGFVDIDHVEMCKGCQKPLALIETARDIGQDIRQKKAFVTHNLAMMAGLPAWKLLYKVEEGVVTQITYTCIYPGQQWGFDYGVHVGSPEQWSEVLYQLHKDHEEKSSCRVVTADCTEDDDDNWERREGRYDGLEI